jgi:parallel beta-helix repeat protein
MKNKITSIGIVCLLVTGLLIGYINFGSEWAKGTYVNGTVYDGSGGPWTLTGSPYIIIGDVNVPVGETLTIEPGIEVKFDGFFSIYIDGSLTAVGLAANRIFITSNMAMPIPGDWDKIQINPTGQIEIEYCDINFGCIGILLNSSSNNIIKNNIFIMDNDFGIYSDNSTSNEIRGNAMWSVGLGINGYLLDHWNTHDIDTTNTVNGKPVYYWKDRIGGVIPPDAGQVILANCTKVNIENQEINHASIGIELGFSSNNYINNNNVSWNKWNCPEVTPNPNSSSTLTIMNFCGIYLYESHSNIITQNSASENEEGIFLWSSDLNKITYNTLFNNNFGIQLWYSSDLTVMGNDVSTDRAIEHQEGDGIHLFCSTIASIILNKVSRSGAGIYIQNSDTIEIKNNNVSICKGEGIRFWCSNKIIVTYNDLWDNGIGIRMFQFSPNIIVHHNNIIDNDIQAIDWLSNQWDDSYPSGGNYWSDFDEPNEGAFDDYHGPEQDILGSDGIVDKGIAAGGGKNPYVIDPNSQDMYPLMEPYIHKSITNDLSEGWNLISIPFIQSNTNIDTVLSSISGAYDAVQWYNGGDLSDHWKHHHSSKPSHMNDLNNIDHTMGLWIHITQPGGIIFDCPGTQPTGSQKISLTPGWNLVGYPSLSDRNRTEALNNIDFTTDVDSIWAFNDTTQNWEEMDESNSFEVGRGYWVHSLVAKIWEVPL